VSSLRDRYPTYRDYARQTLADVLPRQEVAEAVVKKAYTFATSLARNNGDGSFTLMPLPLEAQISPMYGILAGDLEGTGGTEVLMAGNFDGVKPAIGRMSAGYGVFLRSVGNGHFAAVSEVESGFFVPGQARDIERVRTRSGVIYVVSRNNDKPLVFRPIAGTSGSLSAGESAPRR
jgi:hypothetical protein